MAKRRMFSLDVVDTDHFLDMPTSTQNLYFHLSMRADDDGFISSPRRVMLLANATQNDLDLLRMKSYIIPFENGICVIKHRKINNYLRGDRYTKTQYQKEFDELNIENDVYCLNTSSDLVGIPTVATGKDRLGKDSIEIEQITSSKKTCAPAIAGEGKNPIAEKEKKFDKFRLLYPNKKGKANARVLRMKIQGVDLDMIINACKMYAIETKGQEAKYIKHGSTRISQHCREDYETIDREALKREMENTRHEDVEDEPLTAHGKNMKTKYEIFGEGRYDIRMEDKQEVKNKKKEERRLSHNPTGGG